MTKAAPLLIRLIFSFFLLPSPAAGRLSLFPSRRGRVVVESAPEELEHASHSASLLSVALKRPKYFALSSFALSRRNNQCALRPQRKRPARSVRRRFSPSRASRSFSPPPHTRARPTQSRPRTRRPARRRGV